MLVHANVHLNEREFMFVQKLAEGLPPTRAASEAGYSVGHTAALLRKPVVQAALLAFHENTRTVLDVLEASAEAG